MASVLPATIRRKTALKSAIFFILFYHAEEE